MASVRWVLQTVTTHVPDRVLLIVNQHPRLRRLLRETFTPMATGGLTEARIGRGPARGRLIEVDMSSDERRLVTGTYEPWIHSVLPGLLKPGMSMWDIGAHIGYYVITAAALSPTGRHLAVEADPANIARLKHNLALNDLNAEVIEVAVSDRNQQIQFASASELGRISDAGDLVVRGITLDSLLDGRQNPDLVMMDIEGAEGIVVPAALRMLDLIRPMWLMELHGSGGVLAYQALMDHGYTVRASQRGDVGKLVGTQRLHAVFTPNEEV